MDISINVDDYRLNVRAAALIIHNNKLLVHKNINEDFYAVLGGRIQIGENSQETLKREILEEMGKEIEIKGYAATIENFFTLNGKDNHEYMFVYNAEFKDENDKKILETIDNIEGNDYLHYEWLDLDKIDSYNLLPSIMKDALKSNVFPVHKINDDLRGVYK